MCCFTVMLDYSSLLLTCSLTLSRGLLATKNPRSVVGIPTDENRSPQLISYRELNTDKVGGWMMMLN